MKRFIALICLVTFMSGCAFFTDRPALAELTVKAATSRVFYEKPEWKDDAQRVLSVALVFVWDSESVDLQSLETVVLNEIDFSKLTPEEADLLTLLIIAVRQEVEKLVEAQGIELSEKVIVSQVLGWILEVANR